MKWAKPLLVVTLLGFAICLTDCRTPAVRYVYRPSDEQIFLIPQASVVQAPAGNLIVTDGAGGKREVEQIECPYPGILLSEGYFLKLYRDRTEK